MELLELEMIAATRIFKAGALRGVVQNENVVPEVRRGRPRAAPARLCQDPLPPHTSLPTPTKLDHP